MTGVPATRAQWRAWVRSVNPGEVRRRAGVRQGELAGRIGASSGLSVTAAALGGWERGCGLPGDSAHRAAWYEAVTAMAAAVPARGTS